MALPQRRTTIRPEQGRIRCIIAIAAIGGLIIIGQLFNLQILQHTGYALLASEKQEVYQKLFPKRGAIYVREQNELYPLVTDKNYQLVYADPRHIKQPQHFIAAVAPILQLSPEEIKKATTAVSDTNDPYEPLKHKVSDEQVSQLKALQLEGLGFAPEQYRFYSEKNIGGHIFGFVNGNKKGQYGLEGFFDLILAGTSGVIQSARDASGALITVGPRQLEPAKDGADIVLTIDRKIQFTACQMLKKYYDKLRAERGSIIVMDPKTGALIAMCGLPDFDPEHYNENNDINSFNNPAIFYDYEPGSVFKAITVAAGLDTGKISPTTVYNDTGEVKIDNFTIRNFDKKARGQQTMVQALDQSLNTGMIFVVQQTGKEVFKKYVNDFGFGQPTGITLNKEVAGDISNLTRFSNIYSYTASFGQGITVTPLQIVAAYGAIANGGALLKPYIVSEIHRPGKQPEIMSPTPIRQVITKRTATLLSGMLTSVLETSYDKKAKIPGYYFAGKTGTAQVPSPRGGYSDKTIHTFAGFGPVSNPRFVVLIRMDNPQGVAFASDSITPLFAEFAKYLLTYYRIPPDY